MAESRPWHRLFGLSWMDFFRGLPVIVEMEKDLSLKQQLLDLVIIRKQTGALACRLRDGFEDLAAHNLVSFKSYQEALDAWALSELIGHYVNDRKQVSPSMQELLPEEDFRLFAVSVRFPQQLAQQVELRPVQPGVHEVRQFTGTLRLVVVHQLPLAEHNAMLHLFSARADLLQYGAEHYRTRSAETSTLVRQLFDRYRLEIPFMPSILERLEHDDELFQKMTPEEVLKQMTQETIEQLLKDLPVEERLKALSPEELRKRLSPQERLEGLSPEELLAALSPQAREALVRRLESEKNEQRPS